MRHLLTSGSLVVLLALAGCSASTESDSRESSSSTPSTRATSPSVAVPPSTGTSTSFGPRSAEVEGTMVRFRSADTSVDVTIGSDNRTARDFLSMLPLTLSLEEFAGREKISELPRELVTEGSPGSDPENGDLIYFVPWGNLGFYYNTDGIGYSDQTIHLGTYNATPEQLAGLEGDKVTVEVVPRPVVGPTL